MASRVEIVFNYTRGIFKLGGLARMVLLLPTGPSQLLSSCLTVMTCIQ